MANERVLHAPFSGPDRRELASTTRFEIRRRIGAGGFGVVYEAFDNERRAPVALKALTRDDPATIYTFKQEFRSLADIVHPNLVQLYELHRESERWFFTMELVDGSDVIAFVRAGATADAYADTRPVAASSGSNPGEDSPDSPDPAGSAARAPAPTTLPSASGPRGLGPVLDAAVRITASPGSKSVLDAAARISEPPPTLPVFLAPIAPLPAAAFHEARLRAVLAQLVEGLCALHDAGKLHRDIKPSNVLVGRDGRVVLVDFGLAVSHGENTFATASTVAGTPEYMAPEQVQGTGLSPAVDFYAVGALLYEALTGSPPFEGKLMEVLARKQSADPPAPSTRVAGVPPDLDRLCLDLLARAPGARPTGAALRQRVGLADRRSRGPRSNRLKAPFVGRAAERLALKAAFTAVIENRGAGVVLVGGPSGVGKSALCRRVREELREMETSALVLAGRCYEQESVPYKAIDGVMDVLARHLKRLPSAEAEALVPPQIQALSRLFPALDQVEAVREAVEIVATADARELRRKAFQALRELLSRVARKWSTVVFIDDLQWGDADSSAVLAELLSAPDPPPALFVLAYRNDDTSQSPCLRSLLPALTKAARAGLPVQQIALDNLGEDEARTLARLLLAEVGEGSADLAEAIAREAGGRPFFVGELARFSWERPVPSRRPVPRDTTELVVSLDAIVRARAADLPAPARRLLEVVAVAGRPIERAAAARAAELGSEEPGAYHLLRSQRLVRLREAEGREDLETYHDRIREAVVAGLSAEVRIEHFRKLAAAFEGTGLCDAETLATYCLEASDRPRAAFFAAVAAAEAARALAFDSAVRLYRLALDLHAATPEISAVTLRALREGLGNALVDTGRGPEAAEAFLSAIEGAEPSHELTLRQRSAEQLLISGHMESGLSELRVVLQEVQISLPETPWQTALGIAFRGLLLLLRGLRFRPRAEADVAPAALLRIDTCASVSKSFGLIDTARGAYFALRHLALALAAGERRRVLRALALVVAYGGGRGGRQPSLPFRRAAAVAHAIAGQIDDPYGSALLRMCEGVSGALRGQWQQSRDDLEAAVSTFRERCTGTTWETDTSHQFILVALAWEGDWKQLGERFPPLLLDARARGDLYAETIYELYAGHIVWLLADDPTAAARHAHAAIEAWSRRRFQVPDFYFMFALGEIHLYAERGRGRLALDHLDGLWPALERSLLLLFQLVFIEIIWLRFRALSAALVASHDQETPERRRHLARAAKIARRLAAIDTACARALALFARATLAALSGRTAEAVTTLIATEKACAAADMRQYEVAAQHRRGQLTAGAEGRALVDAAEAWMRGQGARDPERAIVMLAPGIWKS